MRYKTKQDKSGKFYTEGDLPKAELVKEAERQIGLSPVPAQVFFKFTCEKCGERCTFETPNTTFETGECAACGHETPFTKGGFMLQMQLGFPVGKARIEGGPK